MSNTFRSLAAAEIREFLSYKGVKRTGTHALTQKVCHWLYCANCGFLNLKNEATRKAMKSACEWYE